MADNEIDPGTERDSRADRRDVVARYQRAVQLQAADELADLYSEDGRHELPFLFPGLKPQLLGREEIRSTYTAVWAHSDAIPAAIETVGIHYGDDGSTVVVEQIVSGTVRSTSHHFAFPGVVVLHVVNARIVQARDYMDGLAVAQALGRLDAVLKALNAASD